MEIIKKYNIDNRGTDKCYNVNLSIKKDEKLIGVFLDKYIVYALNDLSNEEFYKKNRIKFISETDSVTKHINIIPVGLVEFKNVGELGNSRQSIVIDIGKVENLQKAKDTINNFEKAIKIKYDNKKYMSLYENKNIESTDLDLEHVLASETYKNKLKVMNEKIDRLNFRMEKIENESLTMDGLNANMEAMSINMDIKELKPFLCKIIDYLNKKYKEKIVGQEDKQKLLDLIDKKDDFIIGIDVENEFSEGIVEYLKKYKETSLYLYEKYKDADDRTYLSELIESNNIKNAVE